RADFDSGRAIQNMMLAAWGEGVGSCIASMHREADAKVVLGILDHLKLQQVIDFGYPRPNVVPTIEGKPLKDVLASTGRKPLKDIVYKETMSL
ncbi:MAG TPA: nitroreductase family protein, partial [Anaerolineae bacterium]